MSIHTDDPKEKNKNQPRLDLIDKLLTHPVYGGLAFLLVMYLVFWCSHNSSIGLQSFLTTHLSEWASVNNVFQSQGIHWLGLISWGVWDGFKTVLTFIPNLITLFMLLQFLESSGFLSRVAQGLDQNFSKLGLEGRSLIPLLLGLGCNVPAVLSCRSIKNKQARFCTLLMLPFMACNARLAIFSVFAALFFPNQGNLVLWGLYVLGFSVALLTFWVLGGGDKNLNINQEKTIEKIEDLPVWQMPNLLILWRQALVKIKAFILKTSFVIIPISALIYILFHYEENLASSSLGIWAQKSSVLFAPLGFDAQYWPLILALLAGILAKEMVLSVLAGIYAGGLQQMLEILDPAVVLAFLVFTLLYMPCISVLAAIRKELNTAWAGFSFFWTTGLAYGLASLTYAFLSQNALLFSEAALATSFFVLITKKSLKNKVKLAKNIGTAVLISS
ncbi:MAG: nucleoside recognition domain-containing protein [Gammaproteobacteria bacterium]